MVDQNFDGTKSCNQVTWTHTGVLLQFAFISMNERMYDPVQGRMLSPDILVQFPYSSQGYNRYSYVVNNPLLFTDPSGYESDTSGTGWLQPFYVDPVQIPEPLPIYDFDAEMNYWSPSSHNAAPPMMPPAGWTGKQTPLKDVSVIAKAKSKEPLITREKLFFHPLTTANLFSWYSLTGGALYVPDDKTLQKLFNDMKKAGLINPTIIQPVKGYVGLYYQGVNANNTDYHLSLGVFNMYFLQSGDTYIPVGMSDYYNFDPQNRGFFGEAITTFGRGWPGVYFDIRGRITPDQDYIDISYKK